VSLDDWILALHLLSAFAYVAGMIVFWVLIYAAWRTDTPDGNIRREPIVRIGMITTGVGAVGTIVFGLWLTFSVGGYRIWNFWILAALVLWAIAGGVGGRTGKEYQKAMDKAKELEAANQTGPNAELLALNRTSQGVRLHAIASAALVLLLIDMIWKPFA
jgi:uncharacterized membrane protein